MDQNSKAYNEEKEKKSSGHHFGPGGSSAAGIGSPYERDYDYDPRTIKYNPATGSGYSKRTADSITGPPPLPSRTEPETTYNQVPRSSFGEQGQEREESKTERFSGRTASSVRGVWSGIHVSISGCNSLGLIYWAVITHNGCMQGVGEVLRGGSMSTLDRILGGKEDAAKDDEITRKGEEEIRKAWSGDA